MSIKNIIILGSAGLIGQELQKILLKKKSYNLFCLDKKSNPNQSKKVSFIKGDVLNENTLKKLPKKVDIIFFLIGKLGGPESLKIENASKYFKLNTETLVKILKFFNFKKIIFLSSEHVYGDNVVLKKNEATKIEPEPKNYYGLSKLISEKYLHKYFLEKKNISVDIIRTPRVISIKQESFIRNISKKIDLKKSLLINSNNQLNLIYVTDLINALIKCLNKINSKFRILNVFNNDQPISIEKIMKIILKIKGKKNKIKFNKKKIYDHNPINLKISNSDTKIKLGWNPKKKNKSLITEVILNEIK